ncbi:hypothetical protein QL093DRAFT_2565262 [Fusarium oxysporum]|nr:hypothetical protein QL093DRAFT_2565262 [Fusarium oxysporum]
MRNIDRTVTNMDNRESTSNASYDPLSLQCRLGVNQLDGAKYVNVEGALVDASGDELIALQDGGGSFGVIRRVDHQSVHVERARWSSDPRIGNGFSVSCPWVDDDHEEGRKWIGQIEALSTCDIHINDETAGYGVYGRARTLNFKIPRPKMVKILAKYNDTIPSPGFFFQIIAASPEEAPSKVTDQWTLALKQELLEQDPKSILELASVGFLDDGELDLKTAFGDRYEALMSAKKRIGPRNILRSNTKIVKLRVMVFNFQYRLTPFIR